MIRVNFGFFLIVVGLFVAPALFMPGHPGEEPGDRLEHALTLPYVQPQIPLPDGGMPPRGGSLGILPLRRSAAVVPRGAMPADLVDSDEE